MNGEVQLRGLELVGAGGQRFKTHLVLFAVDTALVAYSGKKQCPLVSEFSTIVNG